MTGHEEVPRVVSASREIAADAGRVFELIADPAQQPRWDGNDNLAEAASGQRVGSWDQVPGTDAHGAPPGLDDAAPP